MVSNIWVAAADNDRTLVVKYVENEGFSANSKDPNGYTPIHAAASYGHIELLRYLISKGGNINIQDNEGDTPLHHTEDVNVAKFLVEELNTDWKIKNNDGKTAADYIEEDDEFPEVVQYLRSLGHEGICIDSSPKNILDSLPRPDEVEDHKISYRYNNDDITIDIDDGKRQRLKEIVEGENPEEGLKEFVRESVHDQLFSNDNDMQNSPASKKRRE